MHLFVQEQARSRRANLALIAEDRCRRDLRRLVDRRVLIDDDCALSTEFETDGFERIGRVGGDTLSGDCAPSEHDLGDHVVCDERRTCHRAVPRHDIDHARRNPSLRDEPTEIHDRETRLLRRFQYDGIAGRNRRHDLPHRLQQGVVPWNNSADDAQGLAQCHAHVGSWNGNRVTLNLCRHASEVFQRIDGCDCVNGF